MEESEFDQGKQQGMILAEMRAMRASMEKIENGFKEFEKTMWVRIEEHSGAIAKLGGELAALTKDVSSLESAKVWVIRTVGGLIIAGLIGLLLKK